MHAMMAESGNLDYRLLRELLGPTWLRISGRDSLAKIAARLEVDPETVRKAILKLQRSGIIRSWSASINPNVLGMACDSALLHCGSNVSVEQAIDELVHVEGVMRIFTFVNDGDIRVVFFHDPRKNNREEILSRITAVCDSEPAYLRWIVHFPSCGLKPGRTDWQLMSLLSKNSRTSVQHLAAMTGVSTRTVRRRLEVLENENAYFIYPAIDVSLVNGFVHWFALEFKDSEMKRQSDLRFAESPEKIVFLDTTSELHTVVAAICSNIAESTRISDLITAQKGAVRVVAKLMRGLVPVQDWIGSQIEMRIEES